MAYTAGLGEGCFFYNENFTIKKTKKTKKTFYCTKKTTWRLICSPVVQIFSVKAEAFIVMAPFY